MIGTTIGPHEIVGKLGEGGMGVVYRAKDTKLGRDVAIKILPDAFAQDADRLARFRREAQVLAALNHPGIAHIYGLEEADGRSALVMELVDGATLADRIAQGPIPVDEALPFARQIAEALEAAHEQGIIHRDLKPANVKVREDGTVKVLDFGLAKAMEPASAQGASVEQDQSRSPTITTPAMTEAGMILGTAAYMSPEQAKGRPADKRSDVWAFGVVLYEMLSGRRAFDGEDVSDTLAAVLRADVDWSALPPVLPPVVRTFLMRCLERNPRQRIPDVATIRLAIDGAFDAAAGRTEAPGLLVSAQPLWRRAMPWAAALVLGVIAGLAVWRLGAVPRRPVIRSSHALERGQSYRQANRHYVAVAPDGSRFVYNIREGLHLREMSALDARLIPGTESQMSGPVFSPDGQSIAFFEPGTMASGWGQLKRISVAGGASVRLTRATPLFGMSWGEDGRILYSTGDRIWEVSESGGDPTEVVASETGHVALTPQRLPGSDWILFSMQPSLGSSFGAIEESSKIVVASRTSGEVRVIRTGGTDARYSPTEHLLYTAGGVVHAIAFDVGTLRTTGGPVPVVDGVEVSTLGMAQFDVSRDGTLIYVPGDTPVERGLEIALADRAGNSKPAGLPAGAYESVRASPDGTQLAIGTDDGNEAIVWTYELNGQSAMRRLTFEGENRYPTWSSDGQRIAFQSDREGDLGIFAQRADGTGGAVRLTTPGPDEAHVPESWSPDGAYLSFDVVEGGQHALWILTLDDGSIAPFHDVQSVEPPASVFSPDGRWVAYHSRSADASALTTSSGVYVEPFPATGARYQAPKQNRDFQPAWSPDGAELTYLPSVAQRQVAISRVSTGSSFEFGTPELAPFDLAGGHLSTARRAFDILPDGRFVGLAEPSVIGEADRAGAPPPIRFVVNWFEELRALFPTESGG